MWSPLVFCLLVGLISASSSPAWKDKKEYVYKVSGRTLASLDLANEFSGILMKASLKIQPRPDGKLQCQLVNPRYAQIHSELSEGPMTYIPSAEVSWKPLDMSKKPFQVEIQRGAITDVLVDKDLRNWEANMIKGIMSQFQMNLNQVPTSKSDDRPDSAMFRIMEETVSGNTETLYEINPMPEHLMVNSDLVPDFQEVKEDGNEFLEVLKHKNYTNSAELPSFVYGLGNIDDEIPAANTMGKFFTRSTMSRAIVSGNLRKFTIQNSFTLNEISVNPTLSDQQQGSVFSSLNVTLERITQQGQIMEDLTRAVRLGGLVYAYAKKPFSRSVETEIVEKPSAIRQWLSMPSMPKFHLMRFGSSASFDAEEFNFEDNQQEAPQINKAAENPFLPYTIGNRGKSVKLEADVPSAIVNLAKEISTDLQDPTKSLQENTLAKFINMIKLTRILDEEELRKVSKGLSPDRQNPSQRAAWEIFRDALAESGSQPALLILESWIESKIIARQEAAHVIASFANSVQHPTTHFMKVFFELIKKPIVTSQWPLNETAMHSFAELARQVYVDDGYYQTNFPTKSFKNLRDKEGSKFVKQVVVPYFRQALDKAIAQNEPNKVHAYIRTLGYIGVPEILQAFEPYLEGKKQASQFQRALMIASMDKLVKTYPEIARVVLFRVYQNAAEIQAVRTAAVFQLMRAQPTREMLQLMAAYTKVDTQEQVNAAVKSSIQNAAALKTGEFVDLQKAAEMAEPLLTEKSYGVHQAGNYIKNYFADQLGVNYKQTAQMYGNSERFYPRGMKIALRSDKNGIRDQRINIHALLSSSEQLYKVLAELGQGYQQEKDRQNQRSDKQQQNPLSSQSIARLLDMKAQAREQLEGSVFLMDINFPYKMFSFSNLTVQQLPAAIERLEKALNTEREINYVKMINGDDVIIAIPTEMGLPFVFNYDAPMFFRVAGKIRAAAQPQMSQNGRIQTPDSIKIKSELSVTIGRKVQGHISFLTSFDGQQYFSGIDKMLQVHVPVHGTFELNLKENEMKLNIEPKEIHRNAPLVHYSTWPFTSRRDIMDFRPLVAQKHSQYIKPDNLRFVDTVVGKKEPGLAFHVQMVHDKNTLKMSDMKFFTNKGMAGVLDGVKNLWNDNDVQYSQLNITFLPDESSVKKIQVKLGYDETYSKRGENQPLSWEQIAEASKSSERREHFLKGAASDIKNVQAQVVDASVTFQGERQVKYVVAGAIATSNVDPKSRVYAYYRSDSENGTPTEVTLEAVNQVSNTNSLNMQDAFRIEPRAQSEVEVTFNSPNKESAYIKANIRASRSDKRKEYLKEQPMYAQCQRNMRVGNNQSPACVNMTVSAHFLDKIDMDLKHENIDPALADAVEILFDHYKFKYYPSIEINRQQSQPKGHLKVETRVNEDLESFNVSVYTRKDETTFRDIELSEYAKVLIPHPSYSLSRRLMAKALDIDTINPVCVIDQTQVTTFSNWTYGAAISKQWTLVAQLVPRRSNERQEVFSVEKQLKSQRHNMVVLVRDSKESSKGKDVKILVSRPETDFEIVEITLKPDEQQRTQAKGSVTINEKPVELSPAESQDVGDGLIQVFALSNGEVKVTVQDRFDLIYDGVRVKLEGTTDVLRGATRGICGQFNDQQNEDSLTPQNCYARNPKKFVQSYEVEGQEGQQVRQQFSKKSDECVDRDMPLYINVIRQADTKDRKDEEDSTENDCTQHRTRYVEQDGDICFTTKVVPTCKSRCQAQGYITKKVPAHCIKNTLVSKLWKKQIDNGGSPDFSHKQEDKKVQLEIPQSCST
ncbi:vitellogenin [Diabrotica virgifera virgifera]|uniref:Vitellogenin-like n=1 Tax=Diabrotica virgifera virgifera TaxID=50390 RepID=A0ABM5IJW0_DIAVI|nr:vitellogenin [Diabrotica virgifera virgifera]